VPCFAWLARYSRLGVVGPKDHLRLPHCFAVFAVIRAGHGPSLVTLNEKNGMRQSVSALASSARQVAASDCKQPYPHNDPISVPVDAGADRKMITDCLQASAYHSLVGKSLLSDIIRISSRVISTFARQYANCNEVSCFTSVAPATFRAQSNFYCDDEPEYLEAVHRQRPTGQSMGVYLSRRLSISSRSFSA
jgi:hypothetical protein